MDRFNEVLRHIEDWLAVAAFAVVFTISFANVLGRYVLNASLAFTGELAVNMAVVLAMIGTTIAMRERAHLGFSLLHDLSRGKLRVVVSLIIAAAVICFFIIVAYYGYWQAISQFEQNRLTPSLRMPQGVFTMSLPVAALLCIYHIAWNTWCELRPGRDHEADEGSGEVIPVG